MERKLLNYLLSRAVAADRVGGKASEQWELRYGIFAGWYVAIKIYWLTILSVCSALREGYCCVLSLAIKGSLLLSLSKCFVENNWCHNGIRQMTVKEQV